MFGEALNQWACLWCEEMMEIMELTIDDYPEEFPWKKLPKELRSRTSVGKWGGSWSVWDFWQSEILLKIRAMCHSRFDGCGVKLPCYPFHKIGLDTTACEWDELEEMVPDVR